MPVGERGWGDAPATVMRQIPAGKCSLISICIPSLQETTPRSNSDERGPVKIWHQFKTSNSCQGNPSAALAAVVCFGSPHSLTCVPRHQCVVSHHNTIWQGRFIQLRLYDLKPCLFKTHQKGVQSVFSRRRGIKGLFSEGHTDMKETEEKHFKRFLTKDKAEIEALREAHQRFTGIIKWRTFCFHFFTFRGRNINKARDSLSINDDKSQL